MSAPAVGIRRLLASARVYDLLQLAVGSNRSHERFVREFVRPAGGERLLDIGCGPAGVLRALPATVRYTGIDESKEYVEAARRTWGDRGEFFRMDACDAELPAAAFDVVVVMGVLHHLDEAGCTKLLRLAARSLIDEGRLVVIEPAREPGQGRVAAWLIAHDRGENVRDAAGYAELVRPYFTEVTLEVRSDLLRIPYTHAILQARLPTRSS